MRKKNVDQGDCMEEKNGFYFLCFIVSVLRYCTSLNGLRKIVWDFKWFPDVVVVVGL